MNYMWEAVLQGAEQGVSAEEIQFYPALAANPYREVFFEDLNRSDLPIEPVEVNAYYRYSAIFGALLDGNLSEYGELRDTLFDILAHSLTILDLREGICRAEYYAKFLREDIMAGLFGPKNAERLNCFNRREKRLVAAGLLRMYKVGSSMRLFARLMRELYPNSITYLDARGVRELLIYVGKRQTRELTGQMELLCDLFIPVDYDVKLFWELHFGLIGTEETMDIGNVMMY